MRLAGATIGFVGLGLMGRPMSLNLLRAGATLIVRNRSPAVVEELARLGMSPAASPAEVARRVGPGVIVLMLPDTPAVEEVCGDLLAGLVAGALIIDMGSTAVDATRRLAARVAGAGAAWLDAPVSGGQTGAEQASLSIMAGGTPEAFARALPILETLGRKATHVGGPGAGQVAKAANQVIVGLTIQAVAEAIALARRSGVDPGRLREALAGGFADSPILGLHGRRMEEGDFRPGARATTQRKDLAQALHLADQAGLDLPATRLALTLYDRLIAQGDGDLDHAALIRVIER